MRPKILVIFPGALGDFICFLPALYQLAREGEPDLFARLGYRDLLPPGIQARSLECHEISRLFVLGADKDERLRRFIARYSAVYSWSGSGREDFVRQVKILSGGNAKIFPFRPEGATMHLADYFLSCLEGEASKAAVPTIPVTADALTWCRSFWRDSGLEGKRVLVLFPGSGAKEKNWPNGSYRAIAEWWQKRFAGETVVLLGPVEQERGLGSEDWGPARVVSGLELGRVATLLRQCTVYLGNDSGVTHLAAGMGVATVALFGPTDPVQWAPRGRSVSIVTQHAECSPCLASVMKTCLHRKCLTSLSPRYVIVELERLMEQTGRDGNLLDKGGCRD